MHKSKLAIYILFCLGVAVSSLFTLDDIGSWNKHDVECTRSNITLYKSLCRSSFQAFNINLVDEESWNLWDHSAVCENIVKDKNTISNLHLCVSALQRCVPNLYDKLYSEFWSLIDPLPLHNEPTATTMARYQYLCEERVCSHYDTRLIQIEDCLPVLSNGDINQSCRSLEQSSSCLISRANKCKPLQWYISFKLGHPGCAGYMTILRRTYSSRPHVEDAKLEALFMVSLLIQSNDSNWQNASSPEEIVQLARQYLFGTLCKEPTDHEVETAARYVVLNENLASDRFKSRVDVDKSDLATLLEAAHQILIDKMIEEQRLSEWMAIWRLEYSLDYLKDIFEVFYNGDEGEHIFKLLQASTMIGNAQRVENRSDDIYASLSDYESKDRRTTGGAGNKVLRSEPKPEHSSAGNLQIQLPLSISIFLAVIGEFSDFINLRF